MLRGMTDAALSSLVTPEVAGMSWSKQKVKNTKIFEKIRKFALSRKVHSLTQRSKSHEPNGFKMLRDIPDAVLSSLVHTEVAGMSWSK